MARAAARCGPNECLCIRREAALLALGQRVPLLAAEVPQQLVAADGVLRGDPGEQGQTLGLTDRSRGLEAGGEAVHTLGVDRASGPDLRAAVAEAGDLEGCALAHGGQRR